MGPFKVISMAFFIPFNFATFYQFYSITSRVLFTKLH